MEGLLPAVPYRQWVLVIPMRGRRDEAVAASLDVLRKGLGTVQVRHNLALMLLEQGRLAEGTRALEETLVLAPDYPLTHYNMGTLLQRGERPDAAIASYLEAVRLDPTLWKAHHNLGLLYQRKGDWRRALEHLAASVRYNAHNSDGAYYMARLLAQHDRPTEAFDFYTRAVWLEPENAEFRIEFGAALASFGRQAEACAQFGEGLRLQPGYRLHPDAKAYLRERCGLAPK